MPMPADVACACFAGELPNAICIESFKSSNALFAGDADTGGGGRPGGPGFRGSPATIGSDKNGFGNVVSPAAFCFISFIDRSVFFGLDFCLVSFWFV